LTQAVSLAWSSKYADPINAEILTLLSDRTNEIDRLVRQAVSESRRTRAILALLWCEALSGDFLPAVPIAAAYELAHAAALVEDDIIDGSKEKSGTDTLPNRNGIAKSLLVSNALLFHAPIFISRYSIENAYTEVIPKLLELFGDCGFQTARGEFLDLALSESTKFSESAYLEMIEMKTGALLGAASASGALIGVGKPESSILKSAYTFGESLGVAYQIFDDLQDYFGAESVMGKMPFHDFKNRKKTLPLIHLFNAATTDELEFLESLMFDPSKMGAEESERIKELMVKRGCDEYCREIAIKYIEKAGKSLTALKKESEAKDRLSEIIQFLSIAY
jgi:geranylgeranyl diphosphate synthase, type I